MRRGRLPRLTTPSHVGGSSFGSASEGLAAADVLMLPSLSEGLPGVLIEAGLSGIPVVATDVGGIREIVRSGETGLVVPPGDSKALGDALRAALANGHEMGSAARSHCLERFEMVKSPPRGTNSSPDCV